LAQQVKAEITIDGENISPFADINISQSLFGHNILNLVIPLDAFKQNNAQILDQTKGFLNQPITVEISSGIFSLLQRTFTFEGIVTNIRMARYQRGAKMIFVTAYSPTVYLSGIPTIRSFHDMSLADIVNQVLADVPSNMTTRVDPKHNEGLEYVVQYRETNMQFIQRLADTYGEWLFYDGAEFVFGELPEKDPIDLPLEKDLLEMDLSMEVVPVNSKARAYDYLKHEVYESTSQTSEITDLDPFGKEILDEHEPNAFSSGGLRMPKHYVSSPQMIDDHARQYMATQSRQMITLTGSSDNIMLRVGSVINITGEKANEVDLDKFIIIGIDHSVDQNLSYTNHITAIPASASSPPANNHVKIPFCETQQATVIENNDPEGLGRVKIRFKWQDDSMTPWVRVMQPFAGQQTEELHGFFFTPEIEDEVLVGFMNDHPDRPFVMGSVYRHHDSQHPSEWHDPDTKRKVIKTRDGNYLELIDEDKKIRIYNDSETINEISLDANNKTITLTNAEGNVISLNDGQSITVTNVDNNSLKMEGGEEITLTSQDGKILIQSKEINIIADEKMYLESKSIEIYGKDSVEINSDKKIAASSGKEVTVDSNGTAKINAMQSVDMESINTTVKGTAKVSIEGAQLSAKGTASANIDGGAMTEIKGMMLKLN